MQSTMECGGIFSLPKPIRRPSIMQRTSDDQPQDMWTTVPPAKSIALTIALPLVSPFIAPSTPHIMWAMGK